MKTESTLKSGSVVFVFCTSLGLGYALVNHFILDKPKTELLIEMICLFVISLVSWQRKKTSNNN